MPRIAPYLSVKLHLDPEMVERIREIARENGRTLASELSVTVRAHYQLSPASETPAKVSRKPKGE